MRCSSINSTSSDVLNGLSSLGCGIDFGVIDVLPILATKPILPGEGVPQARNRLPTEVIYHNLESASQVTFDYAMLLILASILAGIGLVRSANRSTRSSTDTNSLLGYRQRSYCSCLYARIASNESHPCFYFRDKYSGQKASSKR